MRKHLGRRITAVLLMVVVTVMPALVSMAEGIAVAGADDAVNEVLTEVTKESATETEEVLFGEQTVEENAEEERTDTEVVQSEIWTVSTEEKTEGMENSLPDVGKQENSEFVTETLEEIQADTEEMISDKDSAVLMSTNGYTQANAVEWIMGKENTGAGQECVMLVKLYISALGHQLGSIGYAYNLHQYTEAQLGLTSWGWTRYGNTTTPQPGDIVVFDANAYGAYWTGHCGLIYAVDANNYYYIDYNGAGGYEKGTRRHKGLYQFSSVIRPDFKSSIPFDHGGYWEEGYYPVIPDGDYHIVSSLGDQWWLTNAGFDMNDGGNVQLWQYDDMECDDHLYHFEFIPDGKGIGRGFYKITNKLSGKCLDSAGANEWLYDQSTGKRTNVQQWTDSSNTNSNGQRWAVNEIDGGDKGMLYTFQARCSGYYIDLEDEKTESGTNISMWKGDGTVPAQQWRLIPGAPSVGRTIDDGTYQIAPIVAQHKVLSASGTNPESGANIELNSYKGDYRHTFDVKYLGDGYYSIINSYSGASLDVSDASRKLGTNIKLWEYGEGKNAQKWIIKSCGDGYYNVVSKCNGLYLDLEGGNVQDGTNISLWKWYEGSTNQKWKFIPYNKIKLQSPTSTLSNITAVEAGTKFWLDGNGADEIYFTWDGTEPTRNSMKYSNFKNTGLQIPTQGTTCTLKAFGIKEGYEDSNVSVFMYTIKQKAPENPSEEESASESESSSAEESVPTEESSTTEESEADRESPSFPEDEDPQDGVKWHYNEEKVIYKDLSMHGEIATAIKPKTYDGTPYRPAVKVTTTENGKTVTLTEGTDYRVLYFNNTHAGTATVTVRGNGVYKGTVSRKFEIKKKSCKKLKVLTDSMPTNSTSAPKVYVYDGVTLLKENKDYILDGITPNLTATKGRKQIYIIAASDSDYEGTTTAKLTVYDADQSRIQGIINSPESVKLSQSTYPYTGKACKPTAVVTINGQTLTAGKDYAITYQNNKDTGTAFAIITGKGAYAGSVVKKFTIKPSDGEFALKKPIAALTYNGRLQKPKLTVMANGKTLKPNKDYTLTYTNNLHATDRAKVTVRGRGNYTNIPTKTFYFTINPCHIKKASVKGIQGSLTITHTKHLLVEGVDYDIIYGDASGKNKITVTIKAKEGSSFTGEVIKKCAVQK